jgi:thiamine pyrophosphate-dependent acetolactate synthase large subunit-like protein
VRYRVIARGYAKHTGELVVCLATTSRSAVYLLNGLHDVKMEAMPVPAITGSTFHDLGGTHFAQAAETQALLPAVRPSANAASRMQLCHSGSKNRVAVLPLCALVALGFSAQD